MKKIFVHAYMAGNLGDDLFVRLLCKRYPNMTFRVLADSSYKKRFKDICNLKVYSSDDIIVRMIDWLIFKYKRQKRGFWKLMIKTSYATVHIGGSVFVQHTKDFSEAYRLDKEIVERSKRVYIIGANFGPFIDEQYYHTYYELFKRYDGIVFRDRYSYGLFSKLPNVRYAPDLVFNMEQKSYVPGKHQVLISVINMKNRTGDLGISQYYDMYKKFIVALAKEYLLLGYNVKFISFCKYQEDEKTIEEIIELLKEKERRISKCYYNYDLGCCLETFMESEIVIGTRFHSIILGWNAGKKVLPIIYDKKTENILEDSGYGLFIRLEDMEYYLENMSDLVKAVSLAPHMEVESLAKEAVGQFYFFDQILKE